MVIPSTSTSEARELHYTELIDDPDGSHQLVLAAVESCENLLEVGCATGYLTPHFAKKARLVIAIEPDPLAAERARQRGFDVRSTDLQGFAAGYRGPAFDCIVAADVIEHTSDPEAFLRTMLSLLAPSGTVVLSVPNVAHWTIRWSLLRGAFDYTDTGLLDRTHLHFFTRDSLLRLLKGCGLVCESVAYSLDLHMYSRPILPLRPFRHGYWYQRKLLRRLAARWPGCFALQFVVRCRRSGQGYSGCEGKSRFFNERGAR
jgi:SAM-dependent methyltransferase